MDSNQPKLQKEQLILISWSHFELYISMQRIQDLIFRALHVKDNNHLRSEAEAEIFALFKQNITQFFFDCANIVGDDFKDVVSRQSTASIMKTLLSRRDQTGKWFWDSVNPNVRPQIKQALLSTLVSANSNIMRAGANAVAQIAAIEISRGEWLDIINTLAQNTTHQDCNIRKASITTLGYICEECKAVGSEINNQSCEQILGCLLLGLNQMREAVIVQISLQALRDSIPFLKRILENPQFCNRTMEIVLSLLEVEACRNKIYEIFFEFGRYCYHLLPNYIDAIVQFTLRHLQQRNQNSILAFELWDTIGTEYLERRAEEKERINHVNYTLQNFLQLVHPVMLPQVMSCLLILNEDDAAFPELRESAAKTLGTFVECGNREVVEVITSGVSKIITSSNPREKQASALLFGALSQSEDKGYIEVCFTNGFIHLFGLLGDNQQQIVRKNTLNGLLPLSEQFGWVFFNNPNYHEIFLHLLKMSKDIKNQDIRILSLTVLCNVTEELKNYQHDIKKHPDVYLQDLVKTYIQSFRNQEEKESNEKRVLVIMNLIMNAEKKDISNQLIRFMIDEYYKFFKTNIPDKQIILESIMTVIHTSILALCKFASHNELKEDVFAMIDYHIKNYGVDSEAINLISAVSLCYRHDFKKKLDFYWHYIFEALGKIDQKPLFRAALNCASDIARTYENEVYDKLIVVFNLMIRYMGESIDRELKTEILKSLGDLFLGLKRYGETYIDTIINICCNCYEAVYKLADIENERAYTEELKESLIEMYHCVIFSVNDQAHCSPKMAAHFPIICTFIIRTCDVKYKPTVDYIKNCLYLIFDSALLFAANERYRSEVENVLQSKQVADLANSIRRYDNREDIRDLLTFVDNTMKKRH